MQFNNFDSTTFLRDYWQKRPLLIRNPWQFWHNPLTPEDLAGLACEDHVESRLITQSSDDWNAEHGPLPETRFGELGNSPWTLLVQAVDQHVPDVAALIAPFRFVPNWRIDDVMVSYASDGGGVGPHFDHYDVFLVQGLGQRRWQIGGMCNDQTALRSHEDLLLLAKFEVMEEWVLNPGDMLYIPPGIAHNGVAIGPDCMTYSVGFRSPSRKELIGHWCDDLLPEMTDDDRYCDPDLTTQENPGEIPAAAIDRLHAMITEKLTDRAAFARWFGQYSSTPRYPDTDWRPEDPIETDHLRALLAENHPLLRNPASRFSFIRQDDSQLLLFIDGECFYCAGETSVLAEQLCARDRLTVDAGLRGSDDAVTLLAELYNRGNLSFDWS
ncbi:cupin domain-containing protein [Sphingorhabdus sp. SMR4y]|uniref:cupin domain-containing protein n=1 Tax=Sphingorhabdus sp. SMR4y TaxID=2584094 RepID=UPI000B5C337E|nr:cupin domain-containing protein [Sphingorhabdus sp. SMR4y]ASK87297.1 50S ribosomal protein L16 3-hydroxylase [Sphingorhabdus sp. SMR4y]